MQLPDNDDSNLLQIGLYIRQWSDGMIPEIMEKNNISPHFFKTIQDFYYTVPVINDDLFLQKLLETLGEKIWKSRNNFCFKEIDYNMQEIFQNIDWPMQITQRGEKFFDLKAVETYIVRENDLIHTVSQGLCEKATGVLTSLLYNPSGQQDIHSLPYLKLQLVSLNTLLRKAGELNAVDIKHLTKISS